MRNKRLLFVCAVSLILILVVLPLTSACAQPSGPAASPTPAAHPEVNLEMYTLMAGLNPNIIANALADILRESHPWLRATVTESRGTGEVVELTDALPLERKKNVVWHYGFGGLTAQMGLPPMKKAYPDFKILMGSAEVGITFIAYDDKIKTPNDMIGKRVALYPLGDLSNPLFEAILDAWGILNKVEIVRMPVTGFADALKTGSVQLIANTYGMGTPGVYIPSGFTIAIASAGKYHAISLTPQDVAKVSAKRPDHPGAWELIKAGSGGPGFPPEDVGVYMTFTPAMMWDAGNEDVAYELLKATDEHSAEIGNYFKPFGADYNSARTFRIGKRLVEPLKKEQIHPGAIKYHTEKGLVFWK